METNAGKLGLPYGSGFSRKKNQSTDHTHYERRKTARQ